MQEFSRAEVETYFLELSLFFNSPGHFLSGNTIRPHGKEVCDHPGVAGVHVYCVNLKGSRWCG